MRSNRGLRYSAILHATLLAFLFFGFPSFLQRKPDPEPVAISVDILPISAVSNVKPQEKPAEKVEEKKPEAQEKTQKKAAPEAKKEEVKPKEDAVPLPVKEPVKEVKAPEKPKPKPKPKDDDLASILKSVKDQAKAEESKTPTKQKAEPTDKNPAKSDNYNPSLPLSMSETDAIRQQIEQNWVPPIGAKNADVVELHIEMTQDGTVTNVGLASGSDRYNSDPFFRAAADAAMRAVQRASPLKNLPVDKYETWRELTFTFDPKDMVY